MILTRQIEYEFGHLCLDSHWLRQCFLNLFLIYILPFRYKNKHLKNKEISSTFGYNEKIDLILVLISIW